MYSLRLESYVQTDGVGTLQGIGGCIGSNSLGVAPQIRREGQQVIAAEHEFKLSETNFLEPCVVEVIANGERLQAQVLCIFLVQRGTSVVVGFVCLGDTRILNTLAGVVGIPGVVKVVLQQTAT